MNAHDSRISRVWRAVTPAITETVTRFWTGHGVLTEAQAIERAQELVTLAQDTDDAICAVSTAGVVTPAQLGFACFYFRMFVAPSARSPRLIVDLIAESVRALSDARAAPGAPKGVLMEIQNPEVPRYVRDLVWKVREFDFVFIGMSAAGYPLRVCYFPDARLDRN